MQVLFATLLPKCSLLLSRWRSSGWRCRGLKLGRRRPLRLPRLRVDVVGTANTAAAGARSSLEASARPSRKTRGGRPLSRSKSAADASAVVEIGDTMRLTLLTPRTMRIQQRRDSGDVYDDRSSFAIVNRLLPVPSFTAELSACSVPQSALYHVHTMRTAVGSFGVTEAQYAHATLLLATALCGNSVWQLTLAELEAIVRTRNPSALPSSSSSSS